MTTNSIPNNKYYRVRLKHPKTRVQKTPPVRDPSPPPTIALELDEQSIQFTQKCN